MSFWNPNDYSDLSPWEDTTHERSINRNVKHNTTWENLLAKQKLVKIMRPIKRNT